MVHGILFAIVIHALPAGQINYFSVKGAAASGLDPALVRAVIDNESAGDPHAVSSTGAVGLMQLEPETASDCGIHDRDDALSNAICGSKTLRYLIADYGLQRGIAAYNWGAGNVAAHPNEASWPTETRKYVASVVTDYDALQHVSLTPVAPPPSPTPAATPQAQACPDRGVQPIMVGAQIVDSFVTANAVHRGDRGIRVFGSQSALAYAFEQVALDEVFHRVVFPKASCGWRTGIDAFFAGSALFNATSTEFPR